MPMPGFGVPRFEDVREVPRRGDPGFDDRLRRGEASRCPRRGSRRSRSRRSGPGCSRWLGSGRRASRRSARRGRSSRRRQFRAVPFGGALRAARLATSGCSAVFGAHPVDQAQHRGADERRWFSASGVSSVFWHGVARTAAIAPRPRLQALPACGPRAAVARSRSRAASRFARAVRGPRGGSRAPVRGPRGAWRALPRGRVRRACASTRVRASAQLVTRRGRRVAGRRPARRRARGRAGGSMTRVAGSSLGRSRTLSLSVARCGYLSPRAKSGRFESVRLRPPAGSSRARSRRSSARRRRCGGSARRRRPALPRARRRRSSSPVSTTSATALTRSSSLRFITRTPVAERPCWEMPRGAGALDHAADADEDELLVLAHDERAGERALFLGQADRLDAFGAAVGLAVLVDLRALAVAVLGHDEQVHVVARDVHRDHLAVLADVHAAHAGRVAAHRARVGLGEAHRQPGLGDHDDLVVGVDGPHGEQLVVVADVDRDDPVGFDRRVVGRELGLLDGARCASRRRGTRSR